MSEWVSTVAVADFDFWRSAGLIEFSRASLTDGFTTVITRDLLCSEAETVERPEGCGLAVAIVMNGGSVEDGADGLAGLVGSVHSEGRGRPA